VLTVYKDRSFTFEMKQPPVSYLLVKAAKAAKGSGVPNKDKIGKVTKAQAIEIAEKKMAEMNVNDVDAALKCVMGTARSMGIDVVG
jgi:large subunit ribosomal protein L11